MHRTAHVILPSNGLIDVGGAIALDMLDFEGDRLLLDLLNGKTRSRSDRSSRD
ncbi:hypothetical protein K9N68_08830 [Kovacikia minuta CCNUW1]|uniref:hypothetical protein n=1 Tax=Kovacikia minuta TaxID=2931930 RepID=UPI001CCE9B43|nr:hypothetical protein [Kovacikia minuta]UBF27982.1 hypothetical protein K9N68_08830 [Kovacikia minuta CCNUW1]